MEQSPVERPHKAWRLSKPGSSPTFTVNELEAHRARRAGAKVEEVPLDRQAAVAAACAFEAEFGTLDGAEIQEYRNGELFERRPL